MMTAADLDNRVENLIKRYVKHYKTDWTDYDQPKYYKLREQQEEEAYLIVRKCGTYLLTAKDIAENECTRCIYEYYQDCANYYRLNLRKNTIKLVIKAYERG